MGSFLDKLLLGYKQVDNNGVPLPQRPILNIIGSSLIVDNPTLGATDIHVGGGGSSGGILSVESEGSLLPQEPIINFVGFTVADDPAHTRTNITNPVSVLNPPSGLISGTHVVGATETVLIVDSNATLDLKNMVAGVPYYVLTRGDDVGFLPINLQSTGAALLFEEPDDPTGSSPATTATLNTNGTCYELVLLAGTVYSLRS